MERIQAKGRMHEIGKADEEFGVLDFLDLVRAIWVRLPR